MASASEIRKIAFLGNYPPRQCGIATFTFDLLSAVAAEHPGSECYAVPVNDTPQGSEDSHGRALWALGTGVAQSPTAASR